VKTRLTALGGNMLSSEILKKAQRAIVEHGWLKGRFGNEEEGFCMLGALSFAKECTPHGILNTPEYNILNQVIANTYEGACGVTWFNDEIAKGKTEAIEMFNRAIQLAKCKERA
jgi:hypothetical protein